MVELSLTGFYADGDIFAQLSFPARRRSLIHTAATSVQTSNFIGDSPMIKVIFNGGLIGFVLTSMWSSEHVSYAQDFYAGKTIRIVVGFPAGGGVNSVLTRSLKKD
jgi:hypothetical protein